MKSKLLLSISVILLLSGSSSAQIKNDTSKQVSVSLDSFIFRLMVDYVSADTLVLNISEFEKNNISHFGEEHRLVVPILAHPDVYEQNNSSYDKFLPSVYHKEVTHGSPFLIPIYVPGLVISQSYGIVNKKEYLYNYDKVTGNLLLIKDKESPIAVNRELVNSFCLKLDKGGYIFMRVPLINSNEFFQVINKGPKYSCYKLFKNIFINANQKTNGYITDGKDYDEYRDVETYYIVDEKKEEWSIFELTRKSIKKTFGSQNHTVNKYFKDHRYDVITESVLANLVEELNK
ncbi:MAG TPA: hypothetical protein VK622_09055 [Puia sp.]|nr:hypothetical protein [Puia sp.]